MIRTLLSMISPLPLSVVWWRGVAIATLVSLFSIQSWLLNMCEQNELLARAMIQLFSGLVNYEALPEPLPGLCPALLPSLPLITSARPFHDNGQDTDPGASIVLQDSAARAKGSLLLQPDTERCVTPWPANAVYRMDRQRRSALM
jgi:hypothetical protein